MAETQLQTKYGVDPRARLFEKLSRIERKQLLERGYEPVKGEEGTYRYAEPPESKFFPERGMAKATRREQIYLLESGYEPLRGKPYTYAAPIEYAETPPPQPTPTPPPKDIGEWFGRGFAGLWTIIGEQFTPKTPYVPGRLGKPPQTRTQVLIQRVESLQEWFREAPSPKTPKQLELFGYEPIGKRMAQSLEITMVPIGMVRSVEAITGREPSVLGAGISTAISPLPSVQLGPFRIGGEGAFTTAPIEAYWEQTKKHPLLIPGELVGEALLAKFVWGPATHKVWKGTKWVARKTKTAFMEWAFPERALFEKVSPQLFIPEEDVFRVLTKTKRGWEYQPLRITETLTRETGKKTTWKPFTITKPKGFKPIQRAWLPPEPMKATVLRELPKEFVSSTKTGMALITKQVTKQTAKTVAPKLMLPEVAVSFLTVKTVPSLVKYQGKPFQSIYKQKKEVITLSIPKLAPYPTEKKTGKRKTIIEQIPKTLRLPKEEEIIKEIQLPKETQILRQPQLPKERQLLKTTKLPKITELTKQTQSISQMQRQIQKQLQKEVYSRKYKLRFEEPRKKRKKKGIGEEWFWQKHELMTMQEVAKTFGLKTGRR